MGRSPKTEGASGQKTNFTTRGGTSPELSFPVPHTRKASGIMGIGYRYPQASTPPKANDNHTARWLPQSPAVTAPSRREPRRVAADNARGNLLQIATAPPVPGIVLCVIPGFFNLPIDSVGKKSPEKNKPKWGQRQSIRNPSQSEGSIPDGSSRGILKGGIIRAGASYPPLEPASLRTFLPEQESTALLASTRSASGVNFAR